MAGVARIVIGTLLVLLGLVLLLTILGVLFGIFFLLVGIVLIASGVSARGDAERMHRQQEQTNLLLQQQMQLTAMQANRGAYLPTQAQPPPPPPAPAAEKYCPACGQGNARASAFCSRCGKPLPPPS